MNRRNILYIHFDLVGHVINPAARLISAIAYERDWQCRAELYAGRIVSERDYVSALVTRIRDTCSKLGFNTAASTRSLDGSEERRFGCDGLIIIRSHHQVKLCLFEAKYVHDKTSPREWDYVNKGKSHFSSQLQRQDQIPPEVVVWEQFALGIAPGVPRRGFDTWGATCLVRDEVLQFDQARPKNQRWDWNELRKLCIRSSSRGRSLATLLYRAARCGAGKAFPVVDGFAILRYVDELREEVREIKIPANFEVFQEFAPRLVAEWGLSGALYYELNRIT